MADYGSLEVPQTDIYKLKAQQSCDEDPVQVWCPEEQWYWCLQVGDDRILDQAERKNLLFPHSFFFLLGLSKDWTILNHVGGGDLCSTNSNVSIFQTHPIEHPMF